MKGDRGDRGAAAMARASSRTMAKKAPGKPISQVKLLSPVARPSEDDGGAHQLLEAHRGDAKSATTVPEAARAILAGHRKGRHLPEGQLLDGRPLRGHPDALPRPPQRARDRARASSSASRAATSRRTSPRTTSPATALGLDMTARGQEDRSFRKSIDGYIGARPVVRHRRRDCQPRRRAVHAARQRREAADSRHQLLIFDIAEADRVRLARSTRSIRATCITPARRRASARSSPATPSRLKSLPQLGELEDPGAGARHQGE